MFMLSIIIGSLLYPNYCYEVNNANGTRSPADSSPFNIKVSEASQNSTNSNGPSQNINDNYRPSQTHTSTPSQNQFISGEELVADRFAYINSSYANPGCIQTHSGSSQNCTSPNGDIKHPLTGPTPIVNISMRPEIGGKPVPNFLENAEEIVGNGDASVTLSSNHNWGLSDEDDNRDPPVFTKGERFLWQVSMFSKEVSPRVRVCGGCLVTSSAVISAAQCFWGVGPLPPDQFAVAAGEPESDDIDNYEAYEYWREVQDIKLPPRFRGAASRFQDDLAVAVLARPLPPALRPACVSFDWQLDEQQLKGSVGRVVGIEKDVHYGSIARRHRVPHLDDEECLQVAPEDQLQFFTSDKFCAGFRGNREPPICNYDIGSGLVYYLNSSHSIPFLRGIVSLPLGDSCVTAFTHVATHRAFLLRHVSGLEAECARHYPGAGGVQEGGGKTFVCNCYC